MAEALASDIKDNILTCNICLEEYEDPRVLPCYHTFCYDCICDHASRTPTPNRTFHCPICREEVQLPAGGLNQLKKNFVFIKTKDIITQQQERQALEDEQANVAAVAQGTAQKNISCEKHPNNELKFYCDDDDTVICGECIATGHGGHRISSVEQVAKINRDKINAALVKNMKTLNRFKEAVAKGIIRESRDSQITTATIKANKEILEIHHASLHSACDFAQELITNGTDSDIMVHAKSLIERLAEMEKTPVPTPDTPAQISYIPGNSTVQSQPLLAEQGTNFNSAFYPSVFLKKAECVHSFNSVLKDESKNALFQLNGLAIDEEQVYVVDKSRNKVKIFTHAGEFKFDTKVQCPYDVAVSQTVLFITSLGDRCVQMFFKKLKSMTTMNRSHLSNPRGISLNRQGHVMVCGGRKRAIFTFHADSGRLLNTIPLSMCGRPEYITVNSVNDNIVISDSSRHCVYVLSPTGDQLYKYGSTEVSGDGQLHTPQGVCTDSYGHIFIADFWNHRIVALSPQGQFIKYIATEADGLEHPRALAINPAGQLVVAERYGKVKTFQYLQ